MSHKFNYSLIIFVLQRTRDATQSFLARRFTAEHQSGPEIAVPAGDSDADSPSQNNEDVRKFLNYREENVDTSVLGRAINDTRCVRCDKVIDAFY